MASIDKRVGKRGIALRARVSLKGLPPQVQTFRRKIDAQAWIAKTEAALRDGQRLPTGEAKSRTVADLISRYRAEVVPAYSQREQTQRLGKLAWWEARLSRIPALELTTVQIAECRGMLARGEGLGGKPVGPATQTRYLAVIKHVLATAKREWEWLSDNPASRVRSPKEPPGRDRFLSREERTALLDACRASRERRLYPLVVLALSTGGREGELLKLAWRDADLASGRATVRGKNGDKRGLTLNSQAIASLRELASVRQLGSDLVFANARGVAIFPQDAWMEALRVAGIQGFRFHDLRHTFASYLAMSGASLAELAEALGHKTLVMVKRYSHLCETHVSAVVHRMAERFLS